MKILQKKLNNLLLQTETYFSILKTFYSEKRIPPIPSLLIDDKFVSDMKKADTFNKYFCRAMYNLGK